MHSQVPYVQSLSGAQLQPHTRACPALAALLQKLCRMRAAGGSLPHHCRHSASPGETQYHPPALASRILHLPKPENRWLGFPALERNQWCCKGEGQQAQHVSQAPWRLQCAVYVHMHTLPKCMEGGEETGSFVGVKLGPKSNIGLLAPKEQQQPPTHPNPIPFRARLYG